jgi:hypothetical protein
MKQGLALPWTAIEGPPRASLANLGYVPPHCAPACDLPLVVE